MYFNVINVMTFLKTMISFDSTLRRNIKTKSYLDDKNVMQQMTRKKIWIANELKQAGPSSAKAETVKVN